MYIYSGFNGAVTFQLRKWDATVEREGGMAELQWGRNFSVTEIKVHHHIFILCDECFNGAVTFQLRKSPISFISSRCAYGLQWGRNFSVTEIAYEPMTNGFRKGSFNGAVTFQLRKYLTDRDIIKMTA